MSGVAGEVALSPGAAAPLLSAARRGLVALVRYRSLGVGLAVLAVLVLVAIAGPIVWHQDPIATNLGSSLEPPSPAHPMGTDNVGRDVLARFAAGARISLGIAALVTLGGAVAGSLIGLVAGTSSGWLDGVLMRAMDAILAFPPLILAMAVTVGLGVGLRTAGLGIALTSLPYFARLLRSDVIRIRSLPYVEAAVALGATRWRVMLRHVLPHAASTLLIQSAAVFGYTILTLAALGFVGLGAQVPTPEWGVTITDGLQYALTGQWWIGVFPGLGVLVAVAATSVIADRLRDLWDPRGRYAHL